MAHLKNGRHVQKDLDQLRRWSAVGDRPERVRSASRHLSVEEKRSGCCRLTCRAVSPETNQRAREAHCGSRVPVERLEGDRSGHGKTENVQPVTRDVDACSDGSASVTRLSLLSVCSSMWSFCRVKGARCGRQRSQTTRQSVPQPSPRARILGGARILCTREQGKTGCPEIKWGNPERARVCLTWPSCWVLIRRFKIPYTTQGSRSAAPLRASHLDHAHPPVHVVHTAHTP